MVGFLPLLLLGLRAQGEKPPCMLGLALNVSVNGGTKELIDSVVEERKLGCNLLAVSAKWSDLEPSPGMFKLEKLASDLSGSVRAGFTPTLTIQTIDTNNRTLPADLGAEGWDTPKMLNREMALLQAVAKVIPKEIGAVMLGNEVDAYLSTHEEQTAGYLRFLADGRKVLKSAIPGVQVGVTTEFSPLSREAALMARLHEGMDLVSMTYYPVGSDFVVQPASDIIKHFNAMLRFCGSRKLFIQEAGYPASPVLSSSEAKQASFVDGVFDEMAKHRDKLFGVCFFILVDFNDKLVDTFANYYGLHNEHFRGFLSSLGFKKQDGAPRLSWGEFKKRAKAF